ncbi:MlaD family protein [Nocardia sp. CA-128927]|uniref:MlaD family protein n=1 Tax=Nocardia sp. CA-128927 TaxID=3239975 RepID=UPI003D95B969
MWRRHRGLLALTITAIAGTAVAATVTTGTDSRTTQGFCAIMPDAVGLYPGNFVTQMGVRIGTVEHVDPENTSVRVTFAIDDDRKLPAAVKAVTRSRTILADRELEMVGNYAAGPRLEPGRCIALSDTATSKSISEITAATTELVNGLGRTGTDNPVDRALTAVGTELAGNGPAAGTALTTAARAVAEPDAMISTLSQLIADTAPLVATTQQRWSDIDSAMRTAPAGLESTATVVFPAITQIFHYLPNAMNLILDIQQRYGTYLWPGLDAVATALHLAATNQDSIQRLAATLPVLAQSVGALTAGADRGISVIPPRFQIAAPDPGALCAVLNTAVPGSCDTSTGQPAVADVELLQLVLRGGLPR